MISNEQNTFTNLSSFLQRLLDRKQRESWDESRRRLMSSRICGNFGYAILFAFASLISASAQNFGSADHDHAVPVHAIIFAVNHRGLQPEVIDAKAGRYLIHLRNGLDAKGLAFVIQEQTKSKSATIVLQPSKGEKAAYFDLPVGDYEVLVTGYPHFIARIHITP